jgi:hypothetical protein
MSPLARSGTRSRALCALYSIGDLLVLGSDTRAICLIAEAA